MLVLVQSIKSFGNPEISGLLSFLFSFFLSACSALVDLDI